MPAPPNLRDFIARERLPAEFSRLVDSLHAPLAEVIWRRRAAFSGLLTVGLCGPQGSGKSTTAQVLQILLRQAGLRVAVLALDDIYLPRTDRLRLAREVHPLLATRGPPGTHDPLLGERLLERLAADASTAIPRFDKALDDRAPEAVWPVVVGPVEVVIFEGWCVGARPQPQADLAAPINELEAERDSHGVWRRYVNRALEGSYQELFGAIGLLIMLRPPAFEVVRAWRIEQERKLREAGGGAAVMSDAQVGVFIQHYERLSRWIDREMPTRADVVVSLDAAREIAAFDVKA